MSTKNKNTSMTNRLLKPIQKILEKGNPKNSQTWPLPCHPIPIVQLVHATDNEARLVVCPQCHAEYPIEILHQEYHEEKPPYSKSFSNSNEGAIRSCGHKEVISQPTGEDISEINPGKGYQKKYDYQMNHEAASYSPRYAHEGMTTLNYLSDKEKKNFAQYRKSMAKENFNIHQFDDSQAHGFSNVPANNYTMSPRGQENENMEPHYSHFSESKLNFNPHSFGRGRGKLSLPIERASHLRQPGYFQDKQNDNGLGDSQRLLRSTESSDHASHLNPNAPIFKGGFNLKSNVNYLNNAGDREMPHSTWYQQNRKQNGDAKHVSSEASQQYSNHRTSEEVNSIAKFANASDRAPVFCNDCKIWTHTKALANHRGHNVCSLGEYLDHMINLNTEHMEITQKRMTDCLKMMEENKSDLHTAQNLMTTLENTFKEFVYTVDNALPCGQRLLEDINEFSPQNCSNVLEISINSNYVNEFDSKVSNLCEACDKVPKWLLTLWIKSSLGMLLHAFKNQGDQTYVSTSDGKGFSLLITEGDRIKFNSFTKNMPPKKAHILPYDFFKNFLEDIGAKTFMDLSLKDSHLGTVVIRQLTESFWSKQFVYMCSGVLGRSYLKTPFHRVAWKNKSGHHIWGGDHSKRNGSGGERVLKEDNFSTQLTPHDIVPGLIASRFGVKDLSTIFRIYLKGSKDAVDDHSFAMVEEGLETLQYIGDLNNINEVMISQVGIILPIAN